MSKCQSWQSLQILLGGSYCFLGKHVIADFKSKVIGASGKPLTVDCKGAVIK